jgi:hypothetical protein
MKKLTVTKFCGKELKKGELVHNRFGILVCNDCDQKYPAPLMAVYSSGNIMEAGHYCGEKIYERKNQ